MEIKSTIQRLGGVSCEFAGKRTLDLDALKPATMAEPLR
jgi:hypothetical protein